MVRRPWFQVRPVLSLLKLLLLSTLLKHELVGPIRTLELQVAVHVCIEFGLAEPRQLGL